MSQATFGGILKPQHNALKHLTLAQERFFSKIPTWQRFTCGLGQFSPKPGRAFPILKEHID